MTASVRLGLRANASQFLLLVGINALVGGAAGLERSVLPLVGETRFGLESSAAVLAFVAAFGGAKAVTNLVAGALADTAGRKRLLVAGWLLAIPVGPLLAYAPSWGWVVGANVLLGASQGLAWSMTVVMKIDLVGPRRRGLALGLNESVGYLGVSAAAFATGALAATYAPLDVVWVGAIAIAVAGTVVSAVFVRDTAAHVRHEQRFGGGIGRSRRVLFACEQAGFVNNANDALAWGLIPLHLAAHGVSTRSIGVVAATYPAVWGIGQLGAGWLSDRVGRKPLVVAGMLVQGAALAAFAVDGHSTSGAVALAGVLGLGTALVYPTLLAAVSDAVPPRARSRAVGRYRFWRDVGLVAGALLSGAVADAAGAGVAITLAAALTALSGVVVAATAFPPRPRTADMGLGDDSHSEVRLARLPGPSYRPSR